MRDISERLGESNKIHRNCYSLVGICNFFRVHPTRKYEYKCSNTDEEKAAGDVGVKSDLDIVGVDFWQYSLQEHLVRNNKDRYLRWQDDLA